MGDAGAKRFHKFAKTIETDSKQCLVALAYSPLEGPKEGGTCKAVFCVSKRKEGQNPSIFPYC